MAGAMVMPLRANESTTTPRSVSSLRFFLPRMKREKTRGWLSVGNERQPAEASEQHLVLEDFAGQGGLRDPAAAEKADVRAHASDAAEGKLSQMSRSATST